MRNIRNPIRGLLTHKRHRCAILFEGGTHGVHLMLLTTLKGADSILDAKALQAPEIIDAIARRWYNLNMEMKVDRSKARLLWMSESDDSGFVEGTPAERIAMVWPLTCQAFSLSPYHNINAPMRRDIAKLIRPGHATD